MAMTAAADRRDPTAPRRPFRASVDIADVVEQEIWQGDARDISVSGMSVQSALVPEIGEHLACRFRLEDGQQVESRAEVIWTRDGGARDGAFGVKFTTLDETTQRALRKAAPTKPAEKTEAAKPAEKPAVSGSAIAENGKVRIVIPGMEAPLRARVRTRIQDALIVGSDLTFLKLGERVTVDGGGETLGGTITAVDIEVDARSGVPRLILTIDGEERPTSESAPAVPKAVAPVAEAAPAAKPSAEVAPAVERDTRVDAKPAAEPAPTRRAQVRPAAQDTRVLSTSDGHDAPEDDDAGEFDTRTFAQRALHAAKEGSQRLASAAGPALRNAATALGGAVSAARAKLKGASPEAEAVEARPGIGKYGLRPQHATQSDPGSAPKRNRRTMVLAGVGGVAALGIVGFAVAGGPKETTPRPQVTIAPEGVSAEAPNGSDPLAVPSGDPGATAATDPATTAPVQPEPRMINGEGAAMPPDLRSAVNSPSANVANTTPQITTRAPRAALAPVVRAAAPAAAPRGRMTMGNPAVRAGTLVRLRMDGPITGLTGVGARGADLVISVPGRRSMDLGAPIARLDSRIVNSRVINRVTGAELTLHFRTAAPPFSARAQGNVLTLILAATPGVRATARR